MKEMTEKKIRDLVAQMTLEEKAALTSGQDNWHTKAIERLGIPAVRMSDGPHGLRLQQGNNNDFMGRDSLPAVCFPAACATAASFDPTLLRRLGEALGRECQARGIDLLLGPGINMKRLPQCGRNFEYFSEDPLLAGSLGTAFVQGVQSQGAGVSLKHFFANNQEYRRADSSSNMDERTMRELYLPAFEMVVKWARPRTVMASYNKVNGVYSTANTAALKGILRGEWGFDGVVVSDWGATHDRVAAIVAGCDLTMPAEDTDADVVTAVQEGRLAESDLDECCVRILQMVFEAQRRRQAGGEFLFEAHDALARQIAAESFVLLKNDGLLPMEINRRVAFIGAFAKSPRYQGGGSSHINAWRVTSALQAAADAGWKVEYTPGYDLVSGDASKEQIHEAAALARRCEAAVVFVGLPDAYETEGADRRSLAMPAGHNALVEAVCAANPNTVVVLYNGGPVELPWAERPKAILEGYLGGEAVGCATVDVLLGRVSPSGHLPETFPLRLQDTPGYLYYPGEDGQVDYREGVFIGYRYYTSREQPVRYPFGWGLSYTTFTFANLRLEQNAICEGESLTVTVDVTNTGDRAGKALVQLYVEPPHGEVVRPVRELKAFEKIELQQGETKTISLTLSPRAFAHWCRAAHGWRTQAGVYRIQIGANARDILLEQTIQVQAEPLPPEGGFQLSTSIQRVAATQRGHAFMDCCMMDFVNGMASAGLIPDEMRSAIDQLPGGLTFEMMKAMTTRAASAQGMANGADMLLEQPVSMLASFLPDGIKKISALLDQLNGVSI